MDVVTAVGNNIGVVITTVTSVIFLAFNIYQYYRDRTKDRWKKEFERLSNDLRSLRRRITSYSKRYDSPHDGEDMDLYLHTFGRSHRISAHYRRKPYCDLRGESVS